MIHLVIRVQAYQFKIQQKQQYLDEMASILEKLNRTAPNTDIDAEFNEEEFVWDDDIEVRTIRMIELVSQRHTSGALIPGQGIVFLKKNRSDMVLERSKHLQCVCVYARMHNTQSQTRFGESTSDAHARCRSDTSMS